MTNEEKAEEIRLDYTKGGYRESVYAADLEDALKEMAQWKDEYYKKLLDLLVKSGADSDIITNYIKNCI